MNKPIIGNALYQLKRKTHLANLQGCIDDWQELERVTCYHDTKMVNEQYRSLEKSMKWLEDNLK